MKLLNLMSGISREIVTSEPAAVSAVYDLFTKLYGWLKVIATPLAILMIGVLAVRLYLSSDDQSARRIKNALIVVIGGILLLYLAPTIVSTVEDLFPASAALTATSNIF